MEQSFPHPRNAEDVFVTSRIEIDGYEDVLLQPGHFLVANVFADLPPKLGQGTVRAVFLEFVGHTAADTGNNEDLLSSGGVEIQRHKKPPVELVSLSLR